MRRGVKLVVLFVGSAGVTFVAAELLFRQWLKSRPILQAAGQQAAGQPRVFDPDPVRGWRSRPGEHELVFRDRVRGEIVRVSTTVNDRGERLGAPARDGVPEALVVGGSMTFGWGVEDDKTFAAQLGRRVPELRFVNVATGGYGTLQALLTLEQREGPAPRVVIYGFGSFHAERNVAHPSWLSMLYHFSERGHATIPYVSLDDQGELVRHPCAPIYPELDKVRWSRLLTHAALWRERKAFAARATDPDAATVKLLEALRDACSARGATLIVAYLDEDRRDVYTPALERLGIVHVLAPPYTPLPYDMHPNRAYHQELAERLVDPVRAALE